MKMSIEAQKQWDNIPDEEKTQILSGGWCMGCAASSGMTIETGNTGKYGLVLRGKCVVCSGQVSRVVNLKVRKTP